MGTVIAFPGIEVPEPEPEPTFEDWYDDNVADFLARTNNLKADDLDRERVVVIARGLVEQLLGWIGDDEQQ